MQIFGRNNQCKQKYSTEDDHTITKFPSNHQSADFLSNDERNNDSKDIRSLESLDK